jgi:MarR family transcriptional regulator, transcriptional regulator for hemolysin
MDRAIPDPDDVGFVIVEVARLMRTEFERRITDAGLTVTPGEARLLARLARCGPIRQHELAARLDISKMTLTNYLDRLEASGLVARSDDEKDRRAKNVSLTPAATPLLQEIARIGQSVRRIARGGIGDDQWQQFGRLAREARQNLSANKAQLQNETEAQ